FLENENDMSLQNKTITFIGAGNMAEAFIRGLLAKQVIAPQQIIATDVRPDRLELLRRQFNILTESDNAAAVRQADIVVLAVKPQQMSAALATLSARPATLIISIAAGITTDRLERELGGQARVIRVMPNTPALVGAGAAALCAGKFALLEDLQTATAILEAVGIVVPVEEKDLDAVTALSGSGPAYVFLVAEALIQAGISAGLTPAIARRLAIQTVAGAGRLLAESMAEPAELRRQVTSPGGTTEAAVAVLLERQLPGIFREAVAAAAWRSRELSGAK
ncbi:MAG: pyrroline-5-carboxylate reductase, partial [Verrucomicrobiota bacterium]